MKNIVIILFSIIVLTACKKEEKIIPNSLQDLKVTKIKLEKSKDSLTSLILKIDKKITALDTIKKLQIVSVFNIKPSNYKHYISIQGNTMTDKNITVRPQASGLITKVFVKEGQRVSNGQRLFQLDDAVLKNTIHEIKNKLLLAKTTYERQQRLWNQKIGSEMQYLHAKNNKESLENKITTLNTQLKNYRVVAPFSGIIDDLIANKGDLASPQTPLLQIINLSNMYIESDVSENYLATIKKGNDALVNFTSIGEQIKTKVSQIGNNISPANRSFKVRINIHNKKGLIKPNLLADIKIKDFDAKDAIVIPTRLVQIDENGNDFVFTVIKKDSAMIVSKKLVEVKSEYNGKSLIVKGLIKDSLLINEGSRLVSNDQEIEIMTENIIQN